MSADETGHAIRVPLWSREFKEVYWTINAGNPVSLAFYLMFWISLDALKEGDGSYSDFFGCLETSKWRWAQS
jgi:hypothetical protein